MAIARDVESEVEEVGFEYAPKERNYAPTGQPIPLGEFCHPVTAAVNVDDEDCIICGIGVMVIGPGDQAVVTACMHYYHATCLTGWVNNSAADNSNACPYCRTRMCERRARINLDDDAQDENDDAQVGDGDAQHVNDDAPDEHDSAQDENDGSEDGDDGSEDGDDGYADRQTALREYVMQWRAAMETPPEETPEAAVTS